MNELIGFLGVMIAHPDRSGASFLQPSRSILQCLRRFSRHARGTELDWPFRRLQCGFVLPRLRIRRLFYAAGGYFS